MLQVYGIGYSPWSYKARWALAWHRIAYGYHEYLPMVGKLGMRFRLGRWSEPITVPLAILDGQIYDDSWDIAQFADETGAGPCLGTQRDDVAYWNGVSDEILTLGRIRISLAVAEDREAQRASLPPLLRPIPGATALAKLGAQYMLKTYPVETDHSHLNSEIAQRLDVISGALVDRDFLLGTFSYADMAIAASLQMVEPVRGPFIPVEDAVKIHWQNQALATAFPSLCRWRDTIFATQNAPHLESGQSLGPRQ